MFQLQVCEFFNPRGDLDFDLSIQATLLALIYVKLHNLVDLVFLANYDGLFLRLGALPLWDVSHQLIGDLRLGPPKGTVVTDCYATSALVDLNLFIDEFMANFAILRTSFEFEFHLHSKTF